MSDRTRGPGETPGYVTIYTPPGPGISPDERLVSVSLPRVRKTFWGDDDLKRHAEDLADLKVVGQRTIDLYDVNDRLEQRKQDYWLTRMSRRDLEARHSANLEAWDAQHNQAIQQIKRVEERAALDHELAMTELRQKHQTLETKTDAVRGTADIEGEIVQSKAQTRKFQADAERDAAEAQAVEAKRKLRESQRELEAFDDAPRRGDHAPTPEMQQAKAGIQSKRRNHRHIQQEIDAILAPVGGDPQALSEEAYEEYEDLLQALHEANELVGKRGIDDLLRGRPNGHGK